MPKELDKFWQYVTPLEGVRGNSQYFKCNLCGKPIRGTITRFKGHLSGRPRSDVESCPNATSDLALDAIRALDSIVEKKERKQAIRMELGGMTSSSGNVSTSSPSVGAGATASASRASGSGGLRGVGIHSYFQPRTTPGSQPSIISMLKKKEKKEADLMLAKLIYYEGIPINITRSVWWQPTIDAVANAGPGYVAPTYAEMQGPLMKDLKDEVRERMVDIEESWKLSGCTILSDGWTDSKSRSLINFLVYSKHGTIFKKSIDASDKAKDANLLCDLLDQFVKEVGPEHVVQVVTDNASNYVAAGNKLMNMYPSLYWTPCACHCIDLLLEDIGKMAWVREVVDQARTITRYIYNKTTVLSMMRRYTNGRELLRPGVTRFASNFISLQSMFRNMHELRSMFVSREWSDTAMSTRAEGMIVSSLISRDEFWARLKEICSVTTPLVQVLRLVDSDRPTMGYLYEAMARAKEAIMHYYIDHPDEDNEFGNKHMDFWALIDERWWNMLYRPIHGAGAILNPILYFAPNSKYKTDSHANLGLTKCVAGMVQDPTTQSKIFKELESYKHSRGLFGYQSARETRFTIAPELWWANFGAEAPELQTLAIRILSQTCSASGCERNWSAFEKIHSKKRSRLTTNRLNDIVFIYVNLRLYVRQLQKKDEDEPINLTAIDPSYSDAPPVDVVADPDEDLHEAFREEWLDMEQEIDELADEGEAEEHAADEEGEEEEHQHFDPFPPVEIDHGVGSHQVYERQVYRDIESEPDDDEPLLRYRRQRQRPRKSVGGGFGSLGLPPRSATATTSTPTRPPSQSPTATTPISGARGTGTSSSGGRLFSRRGRASDRTY